jgi:hypothetical protein
MAGKIVVSEILSDATSSNTVKIGAGMTLDLNAQGTIVLPASIPAANLTGSLPAGMGGTVVNTWSFGMTGPAVTVAASSWQTIGCGGSISVTSGNKLFVQVAASYYAQSTNTTKHFAINVYFNGASLGDSSWGLGINHGTDYYEGWLTTGSVVQTTIASTGTYTIELKAKTSVGSLRFGGDGRTANGWGYDCPKMLVWEIAG